MTQFNQKPILTVPEAAELPSDSRGLAYALVHPGGIPSIRLGRRLLVPRLDLEALLGTGKHLPQRSKIDRRQASSPSSSAKIR